MQILMKEKSYKSNNKTDKFHQKNQYSRKNSKTKFASIKKMWPSPQIFPTLKK